MNEVKSGVKLLREPLVHFLFVGAAIYLAYGLFVEPTPEEQDDTIVVTAGEVEWMRTRVVKILQPIKSPQFTPRAVFCSIFCPAPHHT
jgi:hypothetical protein